MLQQRFGRIAGLCAVIFALATTGAGAATISVSQSTRTTTAAEVGDGAPSGGSVSDFFVTTSGDILSIGQVEIIAPAALFQHPQGTNTMPPDPAQIVLFPGLSADSWITTPGFTSLLGPDMPGDGTSAWFDLSDDGPQTNFNFARLTLPAGIVGTFNFQVNIADAESPGGVFSQSFSLPFPEPGGAAVAALSVLGVGVMRRRAIRN